MMYEFIYARISKIYMKIRMRCFYSEMYQDCLFFVMVFCEQREALNTEKFQREVMWACERGSFRKCEFELLKCENIMRFFHWIHTHFTAITLLLSFLLLLLLMLFCRLKAKIWASQHTQKEKKEFILFLTKLTSILFLPFYSNIIKAVEAHESEMERCEW